MGLCNGPCRCRTGLCSGATWMAGTSPAMTTAVRSAIGNEADAKRADDYARVNKTDLGHFRKTRFTLTEQKKRDQLFVSAPARGGTAARGEILYPLRVVEAPKAHV